MTRQMVSRRISRRIRNLDGNQSTIFHRNHYQLCLEIVDRLKTHQLSHIALRRYEVTLYENCTEVRRIC